MPATFVLQSNSLGDFYFSLQDEDGETVASSEIYDSREAALNGIEAVRRSAATATVDDQTA
ncbi:MAG: YegP family protein [bacterium]